MCVQAPDTLVSGLCRRIDGEIATRTGLRLQASVIRVHDAATIRAFYALSGGTAGPHWPLVEALYAGRPIRITWWAGDQALVRLQAVKGRTQPADSAPDTIRGRHWCDNPVTNLIHVSDDEEMMARESRLLAALPAGRSIPMGASRRPWNWTRHSALPTLVRILASVLGREPDRVLVLPRSGDAAETAQRSIRALRRLARSAPDSTAARLVGAYLEGENGPLESFISQEQIGDWDALVLRAGLHAVGPWLRRLPGCLDASEERAA
jgi:nucleoside diphosphate kinase